MTELQRPKEPVSSNLRFERTMAKSITQKKAIKFINETGCLLVFPINNSKEPASLWQQFFSRSKMKWEWNDNGDDRVSQMWGLMKKLSSSNSVVYSKWYQGRATFFSKDLFTALLRLSHLYSEDRQRLSRYARDLLDCLESDSPLSTKQLKKLTGLQGRDNERYYNRGMKELFSHFLVVAYGEVDDGAFPSLAVGSTKNIFEDLVIKSHSLSAYDAEMILMRYWPEEKNHFRKFFNKQNI